MTDNLKHSVGASESEYAPEDPLAEEEMLSMQSNDCANEDIPDFSQKSIEGKMTGTSAEPTETSFNRPMRKSVRKRASAPSWRERLQEGHRTDLLEDSDNPSECLDNHSITNELESSERRGPVFSEWAKRSETDDLNHATPQVELFSPRNIKFRPVRRRPSPDPGNDATVEPSLKDEVFKRAYYVQVNRPEWVEIQRNMLPIIGEEQKIMEAIAEHDAVVICGETGSGKTTQLPQFLYEAGYGDPVGPKPGMIGVTEPRRVAAISTAKRVATELGGPHSSKVAYQVRFDTNVRRTTAIKFMTEGILLRELAADFLLKKYSVIIVDEAHERTVNTDVLLGLLTRISWLRREMHGEDGSGVLPLKLVIMSATLRIADFTQNPLLFSSVPPVISIEARQFKV